MAKSSDLKHLPERKSKGHSIRHCVVLITAFRLITHAKERTSCSVGVITPNHLDIQTLLYLIVPVCLFNFDNYLNFILKLATHVSPYKENDHFIKFSNMVTNL